MRDGRAPALLSETPGEPRTPAQVLLAGLLKKQMELAQDPSKEAEYFELIKQSTALQDQVEAERQALATPVGAAQ